MKVNAIHCGSRAHFPWQSHELDARREPRPQIDPNPRSECGAQHTLSVRPQQAFDITRCRHHRVEPAEPEVRAEGRAEPVIGGVPFDGTLRLRLGRQLTARQTCVAVPITV
eukprot:7380330-Prymnesium_polylepis.1